MRDGSVRRSRVAVLMVPAVLVAAVVGVIVGVSSADGDHGHTKVRPKAVAAGGELAAPTRWYSPHSLWNTPIPAHPRIAAHNATLIATLEHTNGIGPAYDYTPAVWYATPRTPTVPVRIELPTAA